MPRTKKRDSVSASLVAGDGAHFTATTLDLPDDLSERDWQAIGQRIFAVERGVQWWVGAWVNYGESHYGAKYRAALEVTGREFQTLANFAWVERRFEPSRRREALSWSHHAEVAALEPEVADRILDDAERERWSVRAVRTAVQNLRHELAPGTSKALAPPKVDIPELNRRIAAGVEKAIELSGAESQREFAEALYGTPSQQGTVSKMKTGKQRPNLATIERMCELVDVTPSFFGLHEGATLPAALVQRAAAEALEALDRGDTKRVRAVLERLATALVEADL